MNSMKNRDTISLIFFIGVGLSFALGSLKYGSIGSGIPNAGLFPLFGGITLIVLSLMLLILVVKLKQPGRKENFFPQKNSWKRLLTVIVILCIYGVAMEYVGFMIATLVFMIFILSIFVTLHTLCWCVTGRKI